MAEEKPDIFKETEQKATESDNGNTESTNTYIEDYEQFMNSFQLQGVSPEEVGLMVARMAQHYMKQNLVLVRSLKVFAKRKNEIQSQVDPQTGKGIPVSKADIIASATPEAYAYEEAKTHSQNILECLNALKSLQRGVLAEYANQ